MLSLCRSEKELIKTKTKIITNFENKYALYGLGYADIQYFRLKRDIMNTRSPNRENKSKKESELKIILRGNEPQQNSICDGSLSAPSDGSRDVLPSWREAGRFYFIATKVRETFICIKSKLLPSPCGRVVNTPSLWNGLFFAKSSCALESLS